MWILSLHTPETRAAPGRRREKHLTLADLTLLKQQKQPASAVSAQTGCSLYFSCRKQLKNSEGGSNERRRQTAVSSGLPAGYACAWQPQRRLYLRRGQAGGTLSEIRNR